MITSTQESAEIIEASIEELHWALNVLRTPDADKVIDYHLGKEDSKPDETTNFSVLTAVETYLSCHQFFYHEDSDFPELADTAGLHIDAARERIRTIITDRVSKTRFEETNPRSLLNIMCSVDTYDAP